MRSLVLRNVFYRAALFALFLPLQSFAVEGGNEGNSSSERLLRIQNSETKVEKRNVLVGNILGVGEGCAGVQLLVPTNSSLTFSIALPSRCPDQSYMLSLSGCGLMMNLTSFKEESILSLLLGSNKLLNATSSNSTISSIKFPPFFLYPYMFNSRYLEELARGCHNVFRPVRIQFATGPNKTLSPPSIYYSLHFAIASIIPAADSRCSSYDVRFPENYAFIDRRQPLGCPFTRQTKFHVGQDEASIRPKDLVKRALHLALFITLLALLLFTIYFKWR